MPLDWNVIPTLIPALSGLGGVWLGGSLTSKRERMKEVALSEKETSYLAILVVSHLDRFADGCVAVVGDDGTSYGQPAGGAEFIKQPLRRLTSIPSRLVLIGSRYHPI